MVTLLLAVVAYFVGTFPTAHLVGRAAGFDPAASGSGNPGATNALRLGGRKVGATVLAGDLVKGALAAGLGWAVGGRWTGVVCGIAAVVGHVAPITRRFQGGKGVATAAGIAAVLEPLAAVVGIAVFVAVVAGTRKASVGSLAATGAGLAVIVLHGRPWQELAGYGAVALVIAIRHRANVSRLLRGDEHTIERRGRTATS